MGIDDKAFYTGLNQMIHCVCDHRAACYGKHRLGAIISEGAEASAQACAKDKSCAGSKRHVSGVMV
jgi:hypothetical protein